MTAVALSNCPMPPKEAMFPILETKREITFPKLIDEMLQDMAMQSPDGFATLSLHVVDQGGLYEILLDASPCAEPDDCRVWMAITECGTVCSTLCRIDMKHHTTIPQELPHFNVLEGRIFWLYATGVKITGVTEDVPTQFNRFA